MVQTTTTQSNVQVGQQAPDFTLPSTAGNPVTLSSWRGKKNVLLAFFPLAFTSVCTKEMCDLYEEMDRFSETDTQVYGISVDSTPTHKEFQYKNGMKTELLSDFKREASRAYGVLDEDRFFARRAYFLIDKQGVIRWKHVESEVGQKRENAEILEQIKKLS